MVKRHIQGFTLIELVVVIVIVGILAMVAVPIYRGYIRRANASEGKALCGSVAAAEKVWFAERGAYRAVSGSNDPAGLGVDASQNKFFRTYTTAIAGTGFTVTTSGVAGTDAAGITIVYTFNPADLTASPWAITDNGTAVNY